MFHNNNKKKTMTAASIVPIPLVAAAVVVAAAGLGYIGVGLRCEAIGKELKALEVQKAALVKQCVNDEYKWARMKAPASMEQALERHGIEMKWPRRNQVVYLDPRDLSDVPNLITPEDKLRYASVSVGGRSGRHGLSSWQD